MIPKTADEMVRLLTATANLKLYLDLTRAAKKHRLDEADIAEIERDVLIEIGKARAAIPEFSFDAGKAILQSEEILAQMFEMARAARIAGQRDQRGRKS